MDRYTLENTALENFGRQVSGIYFNLMKLSEHIPFSKFSHQHLEPICTNLDILIENNVGNTLANAITEVAVKMILVSLKCWLRKHQHCSCQNREYLDKCMNVAVKLACASTHSSVTKLHYARLCDEYNAFTHDFLREYLGTVLEKTTNLKELVSLNHPGVLMSLDLKNLIHWSGYITTANLHELANSSDDIRILNLNNSAISDSSVSSILRFLNLIHLDLTNTKLTAKGKERLIRGLNVSSDHGGNSSSSQRSHLTYLALKVTPSVLKILPECLPNLITLRLYLEKDVDLTVLKGLKQLTSLSLKCSLGVDFACARVLLEQVGCNLIALNLDMRNVNLKFISKNCPALKIFGLRVFLLDQEGNLEPLENYRQHIPIEFRSVERLELKMNGCEIWDVLAHLLSCFTNLKIVKVCCDSEAEYGNVSINECLVKPLREGCLEEIFINGYRLQLNGRHAIISDNHGFSTVVMVNDLEGVIGELIYRKGILNLHRRVRFIPS